MSVGSASLATFVHGVLRSYSDGGPNFGLLIFSKSFIRCLILPNRYDVEEPQSGNDDTSASEQDASFFPLV